MSRLQSAAQRRATAAQRLFPILPLALSSACMADGTAELTARDERPEEVVLGHAYALSDDAAPGWYGGQPFVTPEEQCHPRIQLAVGSDGKPMYGQVCVSNTSRMKAQALVIFDNFSASSATAVATIKLRGTDGDVFIDGTPDAAYSCDEKTLRPRARLYCVSYNTGFERETLYTTPIVAHAEAMFTVNGYGTTTPIWTPSVNISD